MAVPSAHVPRQQQWLEDNANSDARIHVRNQCDAVLEGWDLECRRGDLRCGPMIGLAGARGRVRIHCSWARLLCTLPDRKLQCAKCIQKRNSQANHVDLTKNINGQKRHLRFPQRLGEGARGTHTKIQAKLPLWEDARANRQRLDNGGG